MLTIRKSIVAIVSWLFILLFVYAASSKLLDYQRFVIQLGKSPLLSAVNNWVAWLIPSIEIGLASLLIFERFQLWALYASFSLMVIFSAYILAILNFSEYIPCSCGGILENMTWSQHLWFNILFVVFAALAVIISQIKDQQTTYEIFILSGLVANRGSHANDNMSEDWREGLFRFVDNENKFLPEGLDEAKRQLNDQTSWIYKSLIKPAIGNQQLQNGEVKVHIHLRLPEGMGETENGRNSQEIIDFWTDLFQRMHLSGENDASDISSYAFFPAIK